MEFVLEHEITLKNRSSLIHAHLLIPSKKHVKKEFKSSCRFASQFGNSCHMTLDRIEESYSLTPTPQMTDVVNMKLRYTLSKNVARLLQVNFS